MERFSQLESKTKFLILGAGVIFLLIIVAVVWGVVVRSSDSEPLVLTSTVRDQVNQITQRCSEASNPDECIKNEINSNARLQKNASGCVTLDGEEKDSCIWLVAYENKDEELCREVEDVGKRTDCLDIVFSHQAKNSGDASLCNKVENEQKKNTCKNDIRGPVTSNDCVERYNDADFCSMVSLREEAVEKKDPSICLGAANEDLAAQCYDFAQVDDPDFDGLETVYELEAGSDPRIADTDADGLNDNEEVNEYGTDPTNEDTDGDSFSDGSEVNNGYNPNGEGTL